MQVDDFVDDGGQRDEGGVAPLRLELGQISGRHLAALAGDLEQPVLVNQPFDASRQVERLPGFQALDVFEHVARVRFGGRLAQPSQPGRLAVVAALEQVIEATAMHVRKRFRQGFVDAPVGAGGGLGADALDDIERRKDDVPVSQRTQDAGGQHDALVRLQGELGRSPHRLPVMRQAERLQTQVNT